jgi:hypothetical protein
LVVEEVARENCLLTLAVAVAALVDFAPMPHFL